MSMAGLSALGKWKEDALLGEMQGMDRWMDRERLARWLGWLRTGFAGAAMIVLFLPES